MFTFSGDVPANIHAYLTPFLQAWIEHATAPLFPLATAKYGLVTFRRSPWPVAGPTTVAPAGEVDKATLQVISQNFGA